MAWHGMAWHGIARRGVAGERKPEPKSQTHNTRTQKGEKREENALTLGTACIVAPQALSLYLRKLGCGRSILIVDEDDTTITYHVSRPGALASSDQGGSGRSVSCRFCCLALARSFSVSLSLFLCLCVSLSLRLSLVDETTCRVTRSRG